RSPWIDPIPLLRGRERRATVRRRARLLGGNGGEFSICLVARVTMLWTLLIKDLKRARRNPWPYLINLALPLCITALIGLAFGPASKDGGLGQIKVAVVDDDDSVLSSLLRGAMNQGDFKKHLEARFLERKEALKQIHDNKISAVLIIPKGFTR